MRLFFPIAKVDAESRMVWGYASTEARDDQNEIVTRSALEAALGDYMKFANIREMHQLSAVGVAREAVVNERGLYVGAKIIDERAWAKVAAGVYKGFSIGGRVTGRAADDPQTITALVLNEISLVDRPANPEAVFDFWKAAGEAERGAPSGTPGATAAGSSGGAVMQPVQVWACVEPAHRHLAKADAVQCIAKREHSEAETDPATAEPPAAIEYADPGYQPDGRRRYPIDTPEHIRAAWAYIGRAENASRYAPVQLARIRSRIIARWKERIDPAGPPAAADKAAGPFDAGAASIPRELRGSGDVHAAVAAVAGEGGAPPARLIAIIAALCDFLDAMIAERAEGRDRTPARDAGAETETERPAKAVRHPLAALLHRSAGMLGTDQEALLRTLAEIVPRLDALSKRVDDIARQPLPPKTVAKAVVAISKEGDESDPGAAFDAGVLAAALGRMSAEDRTLTLIKAARMNPIRRSGFTAAPARRP